jgi:hypothetical protein
MYHGRWFAYMILPCPKWKGEKRDTCSFRNPWVALPLNLFFPTHFVLFPSVLAISLSFSNLQTWSCDTNWMMTATHCMMGAT